MSFIITNFFFLLRIYWVNISFWFFQPTFPDQQKKKKNIYLMLNYKLSKIFLINQIAIIVPSNWPYDLLLYVCCKGLGGLRRHTYVSRTQLLYNVPCPQTWAWILAQGRKCTYPFVSQGLWIFKENLTVKFPRQKGP